MSEVKGIMIAGRILAKASVLFMLTACSKRATFSQEVDYFYKKMAWQEAFCLGERVEGKPGEAAICFISPKHAGLDEARRIMVWAAASLLELLRDKGFTEENLEVTIQFKELNGSLVGDSYIAEVALKEGKLTYFIACEGEKRKIRVEDFDEAFPKVAGSPCLEGFRPFSL